MHIVRRGYHDRDGNPGDESPYQGIPAHQGFLKPTRAKQVVYAVQLKFGGCHIRLLGVLLRHGNIKSVTIHPVRMKVTSPESPS